MPTTIIYDTHCLNHFVPSNHPEQPERIQAIKRLLEDHKDELNLLFIGSQKASQKDLMRVHSKEYLQNLQVKVDMGQIIYLDRDTPLSFSSYEAACFAAGSGMKAVDLAIKASKTNALFHAVFCLVRPPGHHAEKEKAMGFCLFNNIAIAASYALAHKKVEKVFIIDFDVHLGNGTQQIFEDDPRVFYFSIHHTTKEFYPEGYIQEKTSENQMLIPIEPGPNSRNEFLETFKEKLKEILPSFQPDLVLISAGFDAVQTDPLGGNIGLKPEDYETITSWIRQEAIKSKVPLGVISMLEGGYDLKNQGLEESAYFHVKGLGDHSTLD